MEIKTIIGDEVNIYIEDFQDVKKLNGKLADFISSFEKQEGVNTNPNSFQTPWLIGSPETEIVLGWVKEILRLGRHVSVDKIWKLWNMFGNVYENGQENLPHSHPNDEFVFNYFVKSPPNSAPFIFTTSGEEIEPIEGRLMVFPGHLKHHVPISNHKGKRITLAGNIRRVN